MASSSRTNRFRTYLYYTVIAISLSGCTIRHTDVYNPVVLKQKKVVFIYGIEDQLKIKETVRNWMTRRGYIVTEDRSMAELTVDFNYQCHWDVIHYTCKRFNFYITDADSGKVLAHSRFWADTPYRTEEQVKDLLERVDGELNKGQDSGSSPARSD